MVKFGIFSVVDHYPRELPRSLREFYCELLEQVQIADELGFDSFWTAEHHFHEYGGIPRPAIWMAAAAQRTKNIGLGAAVVVLSFDNPLRAAEDYAMVDILSEGRLRLGVGSGYLQHEFAGFGIAIEHKREIFDESLEVFLQAWSGQQFSFSGKHHTVEQVQLNVQPLQKPRPPVWIAILRNEAAAFVGRQGLPIMMIPYATTNEFSELGNTIQAYRNAFIDEAGGSPEEATCLFGLHTYCAETREQAHADAREAMDRYVRTRLYAKQRSFDLLLKKNLIACGTPADIIDVARRYQQAGLTHYLAITNFGGMSHDKVVRSMQLLAAEVLPAFS